MGTLERARNYAGVTDLPEAAVVGKALFGPGANQDVEGFLVTRLRLFDGNAEPVVQPGVAAAHPALQATAGDDVGGGDLPGQLQRILRRQHMQGSTEADAARVLRRRTEERQGVGRDAELLREVMVDGSVHVKAHLIRVLDLTLDLPVELRVRLLGRTLHLRVKAEPHRG